ncbi:Type 1 glutamine amidotransferase-like domain-containing protein [Longimicrobium sp.]|uniref:Type 1 glutamine amidotransferase-like domain-containing protein n=1 Tax=Longimicrobium sp. TaxID=2029185 RepID=UPI002BF55951|nr:Type 1 glutamine amidotransferase-like domain-containing protein [Longimicrobium sp.]HSU16590.1 Type 1 glutamine amidotransferase-like domain-containing protein [Longimicrobium sp.]
MRLYLSSFRLGNAPDRLVTLVGEKRRAAVILNACDAMSAGDRELRVRQEIAVMEGLGFQAGELDLRAYAGAPARLAEQLAGCGLVWVRGGNSFVLRGAMKSSGMDDLLRRLLRRDALVYGGFSAAAAVLGPSLHGVELVDDPRAAGDGEITWDCLGVLPYSVAPHYRSDHPESAAVEALVQYYIDHAMLFRALRDGQVIVVDGAREEVVS